jgi:hypothetical protein
MNWIYYILEANLYLLAFYGFYRWFLKQETFYTLNRVYLLASTLMAFLLPVVQAGFLYKLIPGSWNYDAASALLSASAEDAGIHYLSFEFLVPATYFGIACFLCIRILCNVFAVLFLAYKAKTNTYKGMEYFELSQTEVAFSFFGMLFLNPNAAEKDIIIRHEQIHMQQYHSLDTLLLEIIHAFSWFNPVLQYLKQDLSVLHEFIADDLTSSAPFVEKHDYAMLLIQNSLGIPVNALTKPIYNHSSLKQRIKMLNQPKSASRARLRLLLLLPVTCAMICTSTLVFSKNYKLIDLYAGSQAGTQTIRQDTTKRLPPPPPSPPIKALKPPRALSKRNLTPPLAAPRAPKALNRHDMPPPPRAPKAPIAVAAAPVPAVPAIASKESHMPVPPPPPPAEPSKKN